MHNFAGMERILSAKMNYLAEHTKHKIYFITYEQEKVTLPFKMSEKISYIPIDAVLAKREKYSFLLWFYEFHKSRNIFQKQFKSALNQIEPDLIISTVYSFNVIDVIIKIAKELSLKFILESHTKASTILISNKFRYNRYVYCIMKIWDYHTLRLLRYATYVITLTNADSIFWKKYAKQVKVIPNMLTFSPNQTANYNSKRIISVGRYSYEKGYDMLIGAWKLLAHKYPDWQLIIFGNGDSSAYSLLIKNNCIQSNTFCMPATKDIFTEYAKSSIYVMSSRYEGFGLVLAEAMSCGLPCVSFNCPYGPSEIIRDGEDGFLVEPNNINLLADKMEYMMINTTLRRQMGNRARRNISRYSIDKIMNIWINLFDNL